eukprot:scaffold2267_cov92-Cylindrotheca_fusiformis.AAC.13
MSVTVTVINFDTPYSYPTKQRIAEFYGKDGAKWVRRRSPRSSPHWGVIACWPSNSRQTHPKR